MLATLLFSIQIYCDFSGYTDIALGLARMMGYELRINFMQPYFSRSVGEFWRRWHISLSTWFRDYVYIPLGGNRVKLSRHYANLMITFVISGLWHGANWTFVIWGFLHGLYLIVAQATAPLPRVPRSRPRVPRLLALFKMVVTFSLVTFAWIFFRANSVGDSWFIATHLLPPGTAGSSIAEGGRIQPRHGSLSGLVDCRHVCGRVVDSPSVARAPALGPAGLSRPGLQRMYLRDRVLRLLRPSRLHLFSILRGPAAKQHLRGRDPCTYHCHARRELHPSATRHAPRSNHYTPLRMTYALRERRRAVPVSAGVVG